MTIAKGQPWGVLAPLPPSAPVVSSDAAAAGHDVARSDVARSDVARSDVARSDVVGLVGGDLCRTLGGRGSVDRLTSDEAMTFPVDALSVSLDGRPPVRAVAHVVARTAGWRHVLIAANAPWMGDLNVAPRAHPDDGRVDVVEWDLDWRSARKVLARMRQGAHLPHPRLRVSSVATVTVRFPQSRRVWVDGVLSGRARALTVAVEPDALRVVV